MRTSDGCWTCRLRRKKCDEAKPVCSVCAALSLTCHFGRARPPWMDGGRGQNDMADKLKSDIKLRSRSRRGAEASHTSRTGVPTPAAETPDRYHSSDIELALSATDATPSGYSHVAAADTHHRAANPVLAFENWDDTTVPLTIAGLGLANDHNPTGREIWHSASIGYSESTPIMFYLDQVFPWLYPFYSPSPLQGGRFWILEMMSSPVVRQTVLCQSHYFYSLAQHGNTCHDISSKVLERMNDAFTLLRESLGVVMGASIVDHMHCAARVLTGIVQIHRFEIAMSSFFNWQKHLDAAIDLLLQVLEAAGPGVRAESESCPAPTSTSMRLGHSSAEQAAFRFSAALVVLDDVVASVILQREPRLHDRHTELLGDADHRGSIDLEGVLGLQNSIVLQLGRIAALSAWKETCRSAGSLDVLELASRAIPIKGSLVALLTELHVEKAAGPATDVSNALHLLTAQRPDLLALSGKESRFITRLWAHAALIYLSIVISGWQHGDSVVRSSAASIIDAVTGKPLRPALMHTIVWPLRIAACFAQPGQKESLRLMIQALQPGSMFSTLRKALELMEDTWASHSFQNGVDNVSWCFQSQGEQFLLV